MTDLERLHNLFNQRENDSFYVPSRGEGKTFLQCHELAGVVEVGDFETIIVEITSFGDLDYLIPMILTVFEEHKINITEKRFTEFEAMNKKIIFIPKYLFQSKTCGLKSSFYLSMER